MRGFLGGSLLCCVVWTDHLTPLILDPPRSSISVRLSGRFINFSLALCLPHTYSGAPEITLADLGDPPVTQGDTRVTQGYPWVTQDDPWVTQDDPWMTHDDPRMTPG